MPLGAGLPASPIFSPECGGSSSPAVSRRLKLALKHSVLSCRKSDYISPLDDLAFDMYQDPEVAQIIRRLGERKREADAEGAL